MKEQAAIIALWIAFLLYWSATAGNAKPAKEVQVDGVVPVV